ncbi:MAG: phosphatase PAP2 family protein [Phycisphaeraceae bacterium]|nr:phosphatase PAP2 family protein [Phycisphaeraceae bacterium]MCW5763898.1 phosphatase PAP2 family protein [Phycisphaeraceae bacterium]
MSYRSPIERRMARRAMLKRAGVLLLIGVVLLWLDGVLHALLAVGPEHKARLEGKDWYQMFRAAGYLPTWLLIGGTIVLWEWRKRGRAPLGAGVLIGAVVSGLIAEGLKVVFGRHRPDADGAMDWNPFLGAIWNPQEFGSNLGLPSSHVAVAFGAALVIWRLLPGAGGLALLAACGCAVTRLLAGAHSASDVYVGVLVAWGVSVVVCRTGLRREMVGRRVRRLG